MNFSKKLILVYTCIVVFPLLLIILFAINYLQNQMYSEVFQSVQQTVQQQAEDITDSIVSVALVETAIWSNSKLMFLLIRPDSLDEGDIIDTLVNEVTAIDRLLSVLPSLYSVRIFVNNEQIPERWPLVVHSSRTDLSVLDSWEYNYVADYFGNQVGLMDPSVAITKELIKNKQNIGYFQVVIRMEDFFPYLYNKVNEFTSDYIFQVNNIEQYRSLYFDSLVNNIDQVINTKDKKLIPLELTSVTYGGKESVHEL